MKCSTAYENPRASGSDGVIICYCGPPGDEDAVLDYGENLAMKMKYTSSNGWMYYKTDLQTEAGTRATGATNNTTYRTPCPRS